MSRIIGIEEVKYNFDGNVVEGQNIYFTEPMGKSGLGVKSGKVFINNNKIDINEEFTVGDEVEFYYNRFRKVETWKVTKTN